jgi:hypothetical protein
MQTPAVLAIFCEDLREEKSGQDTLIGTIPDNVQTNVPGAIPKLCVYGRIHLDAKGDIPKNFTCKVIGSDGHEFILPGWEPSVVDNAFKASREKGMPLVGLIFRAGFHNFPCKKEGNVTVHIAIDGVNYVAANFRVVALPSTASPQPSAQSQPAASKS